MGLSMSDQLKPCPGCGGKVEVDYNDEYGGYYAACNACEMENCDTREEAAENWNNYVSALEARKPTSARNTAIDAAVMVCDKRARRHEDPYSRDPNRLHYSDEAYECAKAIRALMSQPSEAHPPSRHCMCAECAPSFDEDCQGKSIIHPTDITDDDSEFSTATAYTAPFDGHYGITGQDKPVYLEAGDVVEQKAQSDRNVGEIMAVLRDAQNERVLSFSAKEMRGVLNLWRSEQGLRQFSADAAQNARPYLSNDIDELIGVAQFLHAQPNDEAQAYSKLVAKISQRLLDVQVSQPVAVDAGDENA